MNTSAKHVMKFILPAAVLLVLAVLTAGCVNGGDINPDTAILGDWESEGTYTTNSGITFKQVYHFDSETTGTLSAKGDSGILTTVQVYLGYDEAQSVYLAYTPTTGNYDYLKLAANGKTLVSEYGEIYRKV